MYLTKPRKRAAIIGVIAAVGVLMLSACGGTSNSGTNADYLLNTGEAVVFKTAPTADAMTPNDGLVRSALMQSSMETLGTRTSPVLETTAEVASTSPEHLEPHDPEFTPEDGNPVSYGATDGNKLVITQVRGGFPATTEKDNCNPEHDAACHPTKAQLKTGNLTFPFPAEMSPFDNDTKYLVVSVPENQDATVEITENGTVIQNFNLETGQKADGYPQVYYLPGFQKYDIPIEGKTEKAIPLKPSPYAFTSRTKTFNVTIGYLSLSYWIQPDSSYRTANENLTDANNPNDGFLLAWVSSEIEAVPLKDISLKTDTGKTIQAQYRKGSDVPHMVYFPVPASIKSGTITVTTPKTDEAAPNAPKTATLNFTLPK